MTNNFDSTETTEQEVRDGFRDYMNAVNTFRQRPRVCDTPYGIGAMEAREYLDFCAQTPRGLRDTPIDQVTAGPNGRKPVQEEHVEAFLDSLN
jgi:hypothetical protein